MATNTRATKQKLAITEVLEGQNKFKSAQEIHELLTKAKSKVGLATVYRSLQSMVQAGIVDVIVSSDGESRYRACSQDHHHHLLCRRCGQTREFVAPEIEKLAEVIAKKYNFTDTDHIIEISGICKDCK